MRFSNLFVLLRRFRRDRSGSSIVEFALLAPVLAAIFIGVFDVGRVVFDRTDLHSAVRSGAQYFMAGGDDLDVAVSLIDRSWSQRPEGSEITVVKCCKCAGEDVACGQLCPDGSVPDLFHELIATAHYSGLYGEYEVSVEELVRTR
jgi:Flp pilus assembly pilin Flp